MVDVSTLSEFMVAFSVVFGVIAWYFQMNRAERREQTQLFMQIFDRSDNKEFWEQYFEMIHHWKWDDFDEWWEKYSYETNPKVYSIYMEMNAIFEGIGVLIKKGLIDPSFVDDYYGTLLTNFWEKQEFVTMEFRKRFNAPRRWEWFEYAYQRLKERELTR